MVAKNKIEKWRAYSVPYLESGSVNWKSVPDGIEKVRFWDYASRSYINGKIFWVENKPFKTALKFVSLYHMARENTHFIFENIETGGKYIMRNTDFEHCLKKGVFIHGVILGEWRFERSHNRMSVVPIEFISSIELEKK